MEGECMTILGIQGVNHTHRWRKLYEQLIIGSATIIGWECTDCDAFISQSDLTPEGLKGEITTDDMRLVGPHGGKGQCSDGSIFKEQIYENGELTIVRPEVEEDQSE
jgi:hypothetical protein